MDKLLSVKVTPDWEALVRCIRREGTPQRVHYIELFLDPEVQEAVCQRFNLLEGLNPGDPYFALERQIRLQGFLGYDFVRMGVEGLEMPVKYTLTEDTAELSHKNGRAYVDEHRGPITTWEEFEKYPWPNADAAVTRSLEWYEKHLPENMCVVGSGGFAHFTEFLCWLMGYETFCMALYEQRDLVEAIAQRLNAMYDVVIERILQFDRVKILWGSDDMGYRTGPLVSPDDLRELVLPGHKRMAARAHQAGLPYLLHACGNLELIMEDLIEDVGIDAKHSFEDTIEDVRDVKRQYGDRIAVLGGIDVDFLCRATEPQIRKRVRETLEVCQPGGGYCLGTGNSVANYIPVENYLIMLDEGRKFGA